MPRIAFPYNLKYLLTYRQAWQNHRDIGTMSRCFLRIYLVNHVKCPGAFKAYEVSSGDFKKHSAGPDTVFFRGKLR